jgi:DNA-binding XRE family transcriptional regulator
MMNCALIGRATRCQNSRATEEIRREYPSRTNRKGITQEKLAELVDLNIRSVQKIEAGQINVLVTTTMRIQHALDCPWGKLMS